MGFQKLLVTLDRSELAETTLNYAMRVADPGARLHLISVIPYHSADSLMSVANSVEIAFTGVPASLLDPHPAQAEEIADTKLYLEKIKAQVEARGFTATIETPPGIVVDTILKTAAREDFDVIVMTTHGRTGFSRLVLGSVAEGVLHKSAIPVLFVPEAATRL